MGAGIRVGEQKQKNRAQWLFMCQWVIGLVEQDFSIGVHHSQGNKSWFFRGGGA